jgi:acetyltransferase-like isoleucine patch superfamily enzyme
MRAADVVQRARIAWYRRLWSCTEVTGAPQLRAQLLLAGDGAIGFGRDVIFGWEPNPGFRTGYSYVEARYEDARIAIGDGCHFNNGVTIVAEGPGIEIGRRCSAGPGVHVYDSDFHPLAAAARRAGAAPARAAVTIGDDVFLGTGCIVLKGTTIGDGSVVGAGAVVSGDVPSDAVVAGNPARVVRDGARG